MFHVHARTSGGLWPRQAATARRAATLWSSLAWSSSPKNTDTSGGKLKIEKFRSFFSASNGFVVRFSFCARVRGGAAVLVGVLTAGLRCVPLRLLARRCLAAPAPLGAVDHNRIFRFGARAHFRFQLGALGVSSSPGKLGPPELREQVSPAACMCIFIFGFACICTRALHGARLVPPRATFPRSPTTNHSCIHPNLLSWRVVRAAARRCLHALSLIHKQFASCPPTLPLACLSLH